MILVNTASVNFTRGYIGCSSCCLVYCGLVDLILFLILCMCPLAVAIDKERCLVTRSIFKLVHVEKKPFLITCLRVCLTGLKILVCYHWYISGLVQSTMNLLDVWRLCVGLRWVVVVSFTCHMPGVPLRWHYKTSWPFFLTFLFLGVHFSVQSSLQSFPVEIISPVWRWGNVCAVLPLIVINGIRFSSALWVSWIFFPSRRITWGPLEIFTFFSQKVWTLIWLYVAPLYSMPWIWLWLGGILIQLSYSIVLWVKFSLH